jgi:hypothetical protein
VYANGVAYDYSEADIVYIPAFPYPKNQIITRVANTSKDSIEIIVDQPILFRRMLYDSISLDLHPRLRVEATHYANTDNGGRREILKLVKYDY